MRRRTLLLAGGVASCGALAARTLSVAERLGALSEDSADVALSALTLAREIYPDLEIARYMGVIEGLARRVAVIAGGTADPEQRIRSLNTVLFRDEKYRYDLNPFARSVETYNFLHGILDTKLGTCVTLPMLYITVAQKVGYPIYPVPVPDHYFVRYRHPTFAGANIECTSRGNCYTDASYIERFAVSKKGLESGAYMRTMTYREYLGHLISFTSGALFARQRNQQAFDYLRIAVKLDPRDALLNWNLGQALTGLSKVSDDASRDRLRREGDFYLRRSEDLGYVSQEQVPRAKEIRGKQ